MVQGNLAESGWCILSGVLSAGACSAVAKELADVFSRQDQGVIEGRSRQVVGGRNLQSNWQDWRRICRVDSVDGLLQQTLGARAGLVRILFFDKPHGQSWNMGVHRDRTIAIAAHHDPPNPYSKPTLKAGVPHVVADDALLERMVTLRLHLDPMHAGNGPLVVVPGSHQNRETSDRAATEEIHCQAGDVFVMRPLLLHGSLSRDPESQDHRRVVHMEFAPEDALAAPYRWFQFDRP